MCLLRTWTSCIQIFIVPVCQEFRSWFIFCRTTATHEISQTSNHNETRVSQRKIRKQRPYTVDRSTKLLLTTGNTRLKSRTKFVERSRWVLANLSRVRFERYVSDYCDMHTHFEPLWVYVYAHLDRICVTLLQAVVCRFLRYVHKITPSSLVAAIPSRTISRTICVLDVLANVSRCEMCRECLTRARAARYSSYTSVVYTRATTITDPPRTFAIGNSTKGKDMYNLYPRQMYTLCIFSE